MRGNVDETIHRTGKLLMSTSLMAMSRFLVTAFNLLHFDQQNHPMPQETRTCFGNQKSVNGPCFQLVCQAAEVVELRIFHFGVSNFDTLRFERELWTQSSLQRLRSGGRSWPQPSTT